MLCIGNVLPLATSYAYGLRVPEAHVLVHNPPRLGAVSIEDIRHKMECIVGELISQF